MRTRPRSWAGLPANTVSLKLIQSWFIRIPCMWISQSFSSRITGIRRRSIFRISPEALSPSSKDYLNPEIHDFIDKYIGGRPGKPTEYRLRLIKLIRELTSSYEDVFTLHAEGSLGAQRLSIYALADFEKYKATAKRAAMIKDGTKDIIYSQLPEFRPEI